MIKNTIQLAQARQNKKELQERLHELGVPNDLMERMQRASYECRMADIEKEIEEYESLLEQKVLYFNKENLPKLIVSLRIASGYTQKALAEELGLPEQQIQRYEQQEYAKVKFERIVQIIRVLSEAVGINIRVKQTSSNPFKPTPETQEAAKILRERKMIVKWGA